MTAFSLSGNSPCFTRSQNISSSILHYDACIQRERERKKKKKEKEKADLSCSWCRMNNTKRACSGARRNIALDNTLHTLAQCRPAS